MKGLALSSSNYKYALFIIILTFLVYGNSIQNGYSLDDHLVNEQNDLTQHGIKNFKEIFSSYSFKEKEFNYEFRPVLILSFALEYSAFGTNPHVSHFISVLLFAVFVILLFYFLRITFPESPPVYLFLGMILFILHPIHTEVVDNIKSRDELLTGIFGISMLLHYVKYMEDKKVYHVFLAVLFLLLAFLSKESFIIYAAVLPFLYLISNVNKGKWSFRIFIPFFILLLTIFLFKMGKMQVLPKESFNREMVFYENPLYFENFAAKIPAGLTISLYYLKLLIWPFTLSYYYGYNEIPISTWGTILPYLSLIFHAGLIYLAIKFLKKDRLFSFAIIIYLINIFASSGILKVIPGIVGERFVFFGSVGFSLAIAILITRIFEKNKWIQRNSSVVKINYKAFTLVLVFFLCYSYSTFSRNKVWKDENTLILNDAEHQTNSAKVQDMAAYRILRKIYSNPKAPENIELLNTAEEHCKKCLEIFPEYIQCINNLGTIYFMRKDYVESEKYYLKGLTIDSSDANVLFNLATIYEAQKQVDLAHKYYQKALSENPEIFNLIPFYKQFVVKNNKQVEAIAFMKEILRIFPQNYNLHLLIIDFYNEQKEYENALFYLDKAYKINPNTELAKFIETIKSINKK